MKTITSILHTKFQLLHAMVIENSIGFNAPKAIMLSGALFLFFILTFGKVMSRDLGQWENTDPEVKKWFKSLMRPDMPNVSCCGEADAYWCDTYYAREGKAYCKITDDRDDGPLGRPHIDVGTEIEIPPEKLKFDRGNPTGHNVIFLRHYYAGSYLVFCFVQSTGG